MYLSMTLSFTVAKVVLALSFLVITFLVDVDVDKR